MVYGEEGLMQMPENEPEVTHRQRSPQQFLQTMPQPRYSLDNAVVHLARKKRTSLLDQMRDEYSPENLFDFPRDPIQKKETSFGSKEIVAESSNIGVNPYEEKEQGYASTDENVIKSLEPISQQRTARFDAQTGLPLEGKTLSRAEFKRLKAIAIQRRDEKIDVLREQHGDDLETFVDMYDDLNEQTRDYISQLKNSIEDNPRFLDKAKVIGKDIVRPVLRPLSALTIGNLPGGMQEGIEKIVGKEVYNSQSDGIDSLIYNPLVYAAILEMGNFAYGPLLGGGAPWYSHISAILGGLILGVCEDIGRLSISSREDGRGGPVASLPGKLIAAPYEIPKGIFTLAKNYLSDVSTRAVELKEKE